MKILVPIKRVPDPYATIRVNSAGSGIETAGLKYEINPFDEIAVEEAVRINESIGAEIVVVSVGSEACEEQLRKALAMGADRALLVDTSEPFDSLGIAKVLAKVVEREKPDVVIMGKQAIDGDSNQAGQMLAALLGWPQATFASEIKFEGASVVVTRETDAGQETLEMKLPAIITTDLRLNQPRYVALPGIIKARSKPLERITLDSIGASPECRVRITSIQAPEKRKAGRIVGGVDELIAALRDEKGVI
jgi:electron transfer flavoprotein beta subunit